MERKLELGQEGHRYFDLNRWGNTVTELNRVLTYEKTMQWGASLYGSASVGQKMLHILFLSVRSTLDWVTLVQNSGY